ncbi:MAG: hypothetical protein JXA20_09775 [Spirochaetes bacterium]|nr:hypothetical protein [Spirochaetota bacterium]
MKKIAVSLLGSLFLVVIAGTDLLPANSRFGQLLIELETSVKWNAQTQQWRNRRTAWIHQVKAADNVGQMRGLLLEFEQQIKWDAQYPQWKNQRNGWMQTVNRAQTQSQLAHTLLTVEASIKYEAQTPNWKSRRQGWINNVNALR